ncbi:MAG TPA: hypothetical protein VEB22_03655 [Phycisphaerales bacterium]|nr:hypothetical protein [Phycisphaerales bacterium]
MNLAELSFRLAPLHGVVSPAPIWQPPTLHQEPAGERFDRQIDALESPPASGGGDEATLEHPFQIIEVDENTIRVRFGTIQDMTPTGVSVDIDVGSFSGTVSIYGGISIDLDGVASSAFVSTSSSGLPANDDDSAYILIGTVAVSAAVIAAINQAVTHSLRFRACDRSSSGESLVDAGTYHFWGI